MDSPRPHSLVIGTHNPGKVHEIRTILGDVPLSLRSLNEFKEVGVAEENEDSYSLNAVAKARYYATTTGLCALADDSGLEVDALGGKPGVFSARYAGERATDADRRKLLLAQLAEQSGKIRSARFVCAVAIASPDQVVLSLTEGICIGSISSEPRGQAGFGYDPLFIPDGYDKTFAELPDSVKNLISHRALALLSTREFLLREVGLLDQLGTGS
jgi:non-canonical purine NTP pyrophosphatase (RdgB/HAM1 family)